MKSHTTFKKQFELMAAKQFAFADDIKSMNDSKMQQYAKLRSSNLRPTVYPALTSQQKTKINVIDKALLDIRKLETEALQLWYEKTLKENLDCVVIEVGTHFPPAANVPSFVTTTSNKEFSILHLDQLASRYEKIKMANYAVRYLPMHLWFGSEPYHKMADIIGKLIDRGKKVIIINNLDLAYADANIKPLINEFNPYIGTQLNYHQISNDVFAPLPTFAQLFPANKDEELTLKVNRLTRHTKNYGDYLENCVQEKSKNNFAQKLAQKKFEIIMTLHAILTNTEQSAEDKLAEFQRFFNKNKLTINKRRDSAAITFLKVVASILLIVTVVSAFYLIPRLWHVKGRDYTKKVTAELNAGNKPAHKI